MFTRSVAALLSGMSEEQLKNFARSDRAPSFFQVEAENRSRRWARYSERDVVMIAMTERLRMKIGYADGLRPETASKIASNATMAVDEALASPIVVWAGYVGAPMDHTDRGDRDNSVGGFNVTGTLEQICKRVADEPNISPTRLFLVNVSEVITEVRKRAAEHGIAFMLSVADA